MPHIVITGSSRGIGMSMARAFLQKGCRVCITSRTKGGLEKALGSLHDQGYGDMVSGLVCEVTRLNDLQGLWDHAAAHGKIDIWINNAGVNHPGDPFHKQDPDKLISVSAVNLTGSILATQVALSGMLDQGGGSIYHMEGFGSDGRMVKGMAVYGATKYATRYLSRSLAREYKGSSVLFGAISPGMVVTDMLLESLEGLPEEKKDALKIFRILADPPERVAPWIVERILKNRKNGRRIAWLTPPKIMWRFLLFMFKKRRVKGLPDF